MFKQFDDLRGLGVQWMQKQEIMTWTEFGYLILISTDFYDFISPFAPYF